MSKPLYFIFFLLSLSLLFSQGTNVTDNNEKDTTAQFIDSTEKVEVYKLNIIRQHITIALFNGIAVTKATYLIKNTTDKTIKYEDSQAVHDIHNIASESMIGHDTLFDFKVLLNGVRVPLTEIIEGLFLWETEYPPNSTNKMDVHFSVNTNNGLIWDGYNEKKRNGFSFAFGIMGYLEDMFEKGSILIQLEDDLDLNDIYGAYPDSIKYNEEKKQLLYIFEDPFPSLEKHIILTYGSYIKDYVFDTENGYIHGGQKEIDYLSEQEINEADFVAVKFNEPFEPKKGLGWTIFFWGVIAGTAAAIIFLVTLIIRLIRKLLL